MKIFQITPEDIPHDMNWLCDIVGVQHLMEIIDVAGGEVLYIPKRQTIELPLKKQAIQREYNGHNARQLARRYGITERRVRGILQELSKAEA